MKTLSGILAGAGLLALSLVATAAHAQTALQPQLDYARTIRDGSLVFVPYVGLDRGPVFYAEYEQVPTASSKTGQLKRLFVNLIPTAHVEKQYEPFLVSNGIRDAKVLSVPAAQACTPSANVRKLLAGVPAPFDPKILGGNYPILCTLSLYFLPEEEQAVRELIAAEPVIDLHAPVPLCKPDSVRLDNAGIVAELESRGVVEVAEDGAVSGNAFEIFTKSGALALERPELFEMPDPRGAWIVFVQQFSVDQTSQIAKLDPERVRVPPYVCRPDPLDPKL